MASMTSEYKGDLRVETVHNATGVTIFTDASVEHGGLGQSFSPTELCATALASCAMTVIGIYGKKHDVDVTGMKAETNLIIDTTKHRIGKIEITITMPDREYTPKQKTMIERATRICSVHASLHPEIEQVFTFNWSC